MRILYADSSALLRAYLHDETGHGELRHLLFERGDTVVTSEITRLEIASAVQAAERAGRVRDAVVVLAGIEADFELGGSIALIELEARRALDDAYSLLRRFRLRALDALHLAVASAEAAVSEIVFVTRDADQAAAARALGLATA